MFHNDRLSQHISDVKVECDSDVARPCLKGAEPCVLNP